MTSATQNPSLELLRGELDPPPPNEHEAATEPMKTRGIIFPGSPVTALGVYGPSYYYLDYLGQLAEVKKHDLDRIRGIFGGRVDLLTAEFPRMSKGTETTPPVVVGWKQDKAAEAMVRACTEKGVWNATARVRGLGAWPDDEGGVILHCGDSVYYKGEWQLPGEIDGFVYPSEVRTPRPLSQTITAGDHSPAAELLDTLKSWHWLRGDVDAYLLLGWICSAMFGGALNWRPMVWLTGDAGTGKSTLQEIIGDIFGPNSLLQPAGATEAAIRQYTGQSTIPVAIDELEADAGSSHAKNVIKLARLASSGGKVIRGGQDHKASEFFVKNSYLFSSILVPDMLDQDISRIAVLDLLALKKGSKAPKPSPKKWGRVGRALRRMVLDNWDRLHDTLEAYRGALAATGHSHRGCDQFGTLLALADLVIFDEEPDQARLDAWAEKLSARIVQDQAQQSADWERCLNYLFGQQIDMFRGGEKLTVGRWILVAAGMDDSDEIDKAQRALSSIGLRVYGRKEGAQLAIANSHDGLARLFEGTRWYASSASNGVWSQAIRRIPCSTATSALSFTMVKSRCWKFPLASIPGLFGEDGLPAAAEPPEAPHNPLTPHDIQDFE